MDDQVVQVVKNYLRAVPPDASFVCIEHLAVSTFLAHQVNTGQELSKDALVKAATKIRPDLPSLSELSQRRTDQSRFDYLAVTIAMNAAGWH